MIQTTKKPQTNKTKDDIEEMKDDAFAPKGRTKHIVETDWPTKEVAQPVKKRKIKRTTNGRLP